MILLLCSIDYSKFGYRMPSVMFMRYGSVMPFKDHKSLLIHTTPWHQALTMAQCDIRRRNFYHHYHNRRIYLLVQHNDDGIQIINITDPYNPTNASSITDGTRYPTLGGANSITTTTIGESTYALVAAYHDNWHPNHKYY